tara:strand:+ start:422 stop:664 length:243 start_codon:yes stop_codon:yes gene_type:complete
MKKSITFEEYKKIIKEEVNSVFGYWKKFQLEAISSRDIKFCQRNVFYRLFDYDLPISYCMDQATNVAIHELMASKGCKWC